MADNYLITGHWGEPHVTAENDRGINAAIFGTGRCVLAVGEQFRAEYIGNNTVRMYDGKLMNNGAAAGIPAGEYIDLIISNASQGMKRNDFIAFQYEKDSSTEIETGKFVVLQGNETAGTARDPILQQQDLLSNEATIDQYALWRVSVSGTAISAPVQVFTVKPVPTKAYVDTAVNNLTKSVSELSGRVDACEKKSFSVTFNPETYALSASASVVTSLVNALKANENVDIEARYTLNDVPIRMKLNVLTNSNNLAFALQGYDGEFYYRWSVNNTGFYYIERTADTVIEKGIEKNWNYQKWASGKVELWSERYILIANKLALTNPSGIAQCTAITAVPSFVPEEAIVNVTPKSKFVLGVNASINETDSQLSVGFFGRADDMETASIGVGSQLPMSCHIVYSE